jgi:hypothetical protein
MMRLAGVGLCLLAACASTPLPPPAPVLSMSVDDVGPVGTACEGVLEHLRGRRPEGTVISSIVTASADQPVPLEALEQVVFVAARRRCANGFAVVRADASDGATGFTQAIAEVWVVAPAAPVIEAAPSP